MKVPEKFGRRIVIVLISIILIGCTNTGPAVLTPKTDIRNVSNGAGAEFVLEVYDVLEKNFYDPTQIKYADLLNAALEGAAVELRKKSIEFNPVKIESSRPFKEAKKKFTEEFQKAKALGGQVEDYDSNYLAFAAADILLEAMNDSHCYFYSPEMMRERNRSHRGEAVYAGIGVILSKLEDDYFYVRLVFPDGPAAKAGIRLYDRLVAVDGQKIPNDPNEIAKKVRGPKGTTVELTVERQKKILHLKVKRDDIIKPFAGRDIIHENGGIFGKITLYCFEYKSYDLVYDYIEEFQKAGVKGIILDLRENPGGKIEVLEFINELFLPENTALYVRKDRVSSYRYTTLFPPFTDLPLVILINNGSASASEVTASACQEACRAKIVGEKSAGAVGMGVTFDLSYDSGMMVTVAQCFSPSGKQLEKNGVTPDILVPLTKEDIENGKDTQLEVAIASLKEMIKSKDEK